MSSFTAFLGNQTKPEFESFDSGSHESRHVTY